MIIFLKGPTVQQMFQDLHPRNIIICTLKLQPKVGEWVRVIFGYWSIPP